MSRETEIREKRVCWLRWGGSPLPYLRALAEDERWMELSVSARYALAKDNCENRAEIEQLLERSGNPPEGWVAAVAAFAKNPSLDKWEELMQFVDPDDLYLRSKNTIAALRRHGVDPNILFRCSSRWGMTPDSIELAESGEVDPEVIEERAIESKSAATGVWLGLAAQAAFARGDRIRMLQYLKRAYQRQDWLEPDFSVYEIRQKGDQELNALFDTLGYPRLPDG